MDLDTAREIVVERLRNQQYSTVEEDGPAHVRALWPSGTWRRFHIRWTDDGWVQFHEVTGSGTGHPDQPGTLFKRESDPREFLAIVDASEQVYIVPCAAIRNHVERVDGMTWRASIESMARHLEEWEWETI